VCSVLGNERAEEYEIWLAAMPMDPLTAPSMRGSGKLMARLEGNELTISGDIEDLESPASGAELRRATPGMRGAVVFKVQIAHEPNAEINDRLQLRGSQIRDLRGGLYYLQINTEKNPLGQLRGWLLR
jgi:hypothetical protein